MSGINLNGFKLSDEQEVYLKAEYKRLQEKIEEENVQGMWRLVAKQEALVMLHKLHKIEVERIAKLGDNIPLINFVQGKDAS